MLLDYLLKRQKEMRQKMNSTSFIQPQHPKSNLIFDKSVIKDLLEKSWIGQTKINGHRIQLHISKNEIVCYTRQGTIHTKKLDKKMIEAIDSYRPAKKNVWTVLDGEWLKSQDKIFLFDILKHENETLQFSTYKDRYKLLKSIYVFCPEITLLRNLKTVDACMKVMKDDKEEHEGLVFKSTTTKGWPDTAIVRCLKEKDS
jgi:ATP-dependent DNA ligase